MTDINRFMKDKNVYLLIYNIDRYGNIIKSEKIF